MSDTKIIKVSEVEEWREYDFAGRVYRIEKPCTVRLIPKGLTHIVTDSEGITHCLPSPGTGDCVLRWKGSVLEEQP